MAINPYQDESRLPFIIAELGINHNGDLQVAKELIDMAKDCGCDAVKFQKRTVDKVYSKEFLASPRQSPWGNTQRDQKEGLEFGKDEYSEVDKYCKEKEIYWFASAWDEDSQIFLRQFNLPFNKIASPMLTHINLIKMVASEKKHTFISTGMSSFEQIDRVVDVFKKEDCPFTLMHCISIYPCPDEWCNINMTQSLRKRYGCPCGYSGHEVGILPSTVAVVQGVVAIERHITLSRSMYGSDQSSSLERKGLELVVRDCRLVKKMLGTGEKSIHEMEEEAMYKLRYFREDFEGE
ncbi:MAG: N-acetylneuraminate synthase family protein [Candidatus Omnitrophota bacterium]